MAWNEAVITNKGLELLGASLSGGSIVITEAKGGEACSDAVSLMGLTMLTEPFHSLNVAKMERHGGKLTVNVRAHNVGLEKGFVLKQIGLFAKLDSRDEQILFAVVQDRNGEEIPSQEENPEFLLEFDFVIPVSNTENICAVISPEIFATMEELNAVCDSFNVNFSETDVKLVGLEKRFDKLDEGLSEHDGNKVRHITAAERTSWNSKAEGNHAHSAATQSASGFMSAADKKKLDGVASGANAYTHPAASGNKHIPAGGASGQILRWAADGTAVWGSDNNTVYSAASQSAAGLMSAADKTKLDGIAAGANNYTYTLPSATSTARGGVKIGYTANGKNYPVQLSNEQMYVNVPWTDNNTTYSVFVKSGTGAAAGLVPAPSTTAGTAKYLREDGTWAVPPDTDTVYTHPSTAGNKHIPTGGAANQILVYSASGTAKWSSTCNAAAITVVTGTVSTSVKTVAYQAGRSKALIIGYPVSCTEGKAGFGSVLLTGLSSNMTAIPSTSAATFSGSGGLSYAVSASGAISVAGYTGGYCVIWFN